MATLTETAIITRKVIRYGILFVIFLIIARSVIGTGIKIYRRFYPPEPPPPTVSFGKLEKIPFPDKPKPENMVLSVETPEGSLPTFPTQTKVYFMPLLGVNLLSLDRAKQISTSLGFNPQEERISETVYRFTHPRANAILELNITTGNFSISYNLEADKSPLDTRPPSPEVAISQAKSLLTGADLLPQDLSGPTAHQFLKVEEKSLNQVLSLSEANLVRVNLFRKNYDDIPSLTPDSGMSNVWFIVSGSRERGKQFIAGEYHYFPIDESKSSTYPIKTADAAWQELQAGDAYFASLGENAPGDDVKIRRVYLAYYDAGIPIEFFHPIIVFEGDRGFLAYVPAITSDYYTE